MGFLSRKKKVLDVGGGRKGGWLPPVFEGYQHVVLDIDPKSGADIICDARELHLQKAEAYDATYSSHNLEHFHPWEVPVVLKGMYHVTKTGGAVYVRVPDIVLAINEMVKIRADFEDALYVSPGGFQISMVDVVYGWGREIQQSGHTFYCHKIAFSRKSLRRHLETAGFVVDQVGESKEYSLEMTAIGHKP